MAGSLVQLPRPSPLSGGVTVSGAKLFCYEAGTTTKRNTYTTSALSVANANPVVADSNGRFGPIWVNPAGGSYKLVLAPAADSDPPASPFWTEDNIPGLISVEALPSSVATIVEGSFTGTLTGMTAATTGTVNYRIIANAAGTGKLCVLYATASIAGTSNTTAMTMTGLPAAVSPAGAAIVICYVADNTVDQLGQATIGAGGTTITFYTDLPFSATGFTSSGTKGISAGWQLIYPL